MKTSTQISQTGPTTWLFILIVKIQAIIQYCHLVRTAKLMLEIFMKPQLAKKQIVGKEPLEVRITNLDSAGAKSLKGKLKSN